MSENEQGQRRRPAGTPVPRSWAEMEQWDVDVVDVSDDMAEVDTSLEALSAETVREWRNWTPAQLLERSERFDGYQLAVEDMKDPDFGDGFTGSPMRRRVMDIEADDLEVSDPAVDLPVHLGRIQVGEDGVGRADDPVFRAQMGRFCRAVSDQMATGYVPDAALMERMQQIDPDQVYARETIMDRVRRPEVSRQIREASGRPRAAEQARAEHDQDRPRRRRLEEKAQARWDASAPPRSERASAGPGPSAEQTAGPQDPYAGIRVEDPSRRLRFDGHIQEDPQADTMNRTALGMDENWRAQMNAGIAGSLASFDQRIRGSRSFGTDGDPKEKTGEIDAYRRTYSSLLMVECLRPLRGGVGASSVVSAAAMYAAAYMASPTFREYTKEIGAGVQDKVDNALNKRAEKMRGKEEKSGWPMKKVWRDRLEKMRADERGDRAPYDLLSATTEEMAINDDAFLAMRQPDADVAGVEQRRVARVRSLYSMAKEDGISEEALSASTRWAVGQRILRNPQMGSMYNETAYDGFAPRGTVQRPGPDGKPVTQWSGQFSNRSGQVITGGGFAPRQPLDAEGHQAVVELSVKEGLESVNSLAEMDEALMAYGMAWKQAVDPEFGRQVRESNPRLAGRLDESAAMIGAMRMDGISPAECHMAYVEGLSSAIEDLEAGNPAVAQMWSDRYGADWKESFAKVLADPDGAVAQMRERRERADAQPEYETQYESPSGARPQPPAQDRPGPRALEAGEGDREPM